MFTMLAVHSKSPLVSSWINASDSLSFINAGCLDVPLYNTVYLGVGSFTSVEP